MELPIDVIPGTGPLRFRWRQIIDTVVGPRSQVCEGPLSNSAEPAVVALIGVVKVQAKELEKLKEQLDAANRRANVAEVLNSNQRQMLDEAWEQAKESTVPNESSTATPPGSSSRDKGRRK